MEISLIHGNCLEIVNELKLNWDEVVIVTDPPFNIGYHYNQYKDNLKDNEYLEMLAGVFQNHKHVMVHYPEMLFKYSVFTQKIPEKVVSWVYNSNTAKQHRDIAYYGIKPDFRLIGQKYKNPSDKRIAKRIEEGKMARLYDWWEINQVKNVSHEKVDHPCQMPIEVMRRTIGIIPKNFTILDPFMGTSTTGVACRQLNRNFIGIEIDEKYFKLASERISSDGNV
jgi:DNA modification methylase